MCFVMLLAFYSHRGLFHSPLKQRKELLELIFCHSKILFIVQKFPLIKKKYSHHLRYDCHMLPFLRNSMTIEHSKTVKLKIKFEIYGMLGMCGGEREKKNVPQDAVQIFAAKSSLRFFSRYF